MTMPAWAQHTSLVPVENQFLPAVFDLLDELRAGRPQSVASTMPGDIVVNVPRQGEWREEMVPPLVEQTTYPLVLALADECASQAGTWINKDGVDSASAGPYQLRNELSAFSKLTKRLYGTSDPIWPFEWEKRRGVYYYRMDPIMAEWWKAARALAV
jgi:hypothetical protein